MSKVKTKDIWKNVPKDKDGNYIEAATNDFGIAIASETIVSTTVEPIKKGSEIFLTAVVNGPPGGAANWNYNGPQGASVNIRLERIPNTGGHYHGGTISDSNAVGTISPNNFVLGAYPQNVRVIHRFPDVCGSIKIISVFSQGNPNTIINQADVLIQGLVPFNQTQSLLLKSPLPEHPSPYWGHPSFIQNFPIHSYKTYRLRYVIINGMEEGFGYNIFNHRRKIINQPSVPSLQGNKGFATKKDALLKWQN